MNAGQGSKTVVVTGGTQGLGRALSLEFAASGYRVLALYHRDVNSAARLDKEFAAAQLAGRTIRHDVAISDADVWSQPEIAGAESLVLIHNASAAFEPRPLHLLKWEEFQENMEVSVKGSWLCTLGMLRTMLKRGGGTIVSVLTSALMSEPPPKGFAAYLAAKAALRALGSSVAAEYGARGIRVFSVSPGFMETALTERWHPAFRDAARQSSAPTDPTQVAERVRQLVEDPTIPASAENYEM